jgi:radical SAM superfamily enzyme YgiQ (UPF0313 family)
MHFTLINPPFEFCCESDLIFSQCLGILSIASYVQEHGHKVTVIDALHEGRNIQEITPEGLLRIGLKNHEIVDRIPSYTDLIGVSGPFSHLALTCHKLIDKIKGSLNYVPVVFGGVYPSTQPRLAVQSQADYLVIGEGELPIAELLDYLRNGKTGPLPKGVAATSHLETLESVSPNRVENLDTIPPPDRAFLPFKEYIIRSQRNALAGRTATIITSRGCPFDCEFCSVHPVCGYSWRPRSAALVLAEIDMLVDKYQVNNIEIEDDNFTLNKSRALDILQGIIERNRRGKRISWIAPNGIRIDTLDDELMQAIAQSNCMRMNIALEHGDKDVLRSMNKKLDLDRALDVARLVNKYKIPCSVFIIYGYPGETRLRFENAVAFYSRMKAIAPKIDFICLIAQPYPGTKLYERMVSEGFLPADMFSTVEKIPRFSTIDAIWIETPDFNKKEVKRRGELLNKELANSAYYRAKLKNMLPQSAIVYARKLYHLWKRSISTNI